MNSGLEGDSQGKKSKDAHRNLKQRAKEARIFVDVRKFSLSISQRSYWKHVPDEHRNIFKDIQSLGRTQYDSYAAQPTIESSYCPWQQERRKRAQTLTCLAERSLEDCLNEAGWRFRVEARLFERFDIEVACKQCRKRLWRSEIEVSPETSNSRSNTLEERQTRREACVCPRSGREYDTFDIGISNIFSERTQEACIDPDGLVLGVTKEPDRIHGLNMTKNFEKLLARRYCHDDRLGFSQKSVDQVVQFSMNPVNGGKPLLYPFLIMEAKSEKSVDNFAQIEVQTCFPIRHALRLQHSLMSMPGNRMDVPGGPLVWFLASKGESWRVYGAYMRAENETNEPSYGITRLWEGTITGQDEAIQLVCIVDYIIDWARDIYRPNILRQLKSLGTDSAATLSTISLDNDFYSIRNDPFTWAKNVSSAQDETASISNRLRRAPTTDAEFSLDADNGILYADCSWMVRDASKIESRVRGLFITDDNVQTLLQIFDTEYQQIKFLKIVKNLLDDSCVELAGVDILDSLEAEWVGQSSHNVMRPYRRSSILARIRTSFFVGSEFELVRELTYLAITVPAYRKLFGKSPKIAKIPEPKSEDPTTTLGVIDEFRSYCKMRENDHLSCCISRRSFCFHPAGPATDGSRALHFHILPDEDPKSFDIDKCMQGIVHRVYETCRIGRRRPKETFLRNPEFVHKIPSSPVPHECSKHNESVLTISPAFTSGLGQLSERNLATLCLYSHVGNPGMLHSWIIRQLIPLMTSAACILATDRRADTIPNGPWNDSKVTTHYLIREAGQRFAASEDAITCDIGDWIMSMKPSMSDLKGHTLKPQSMRFANLVKFATCCELELDRKCENSSRLRKEVLYSDYHYRRWNYTTKGWQKCHPSEKKTASFAEAGLLEISRYDRSTTDDAAVSMHSENQFLSHVSIDLEVDQQEPPNKRHRISSPEKQTTSNKKSVAARLGSRRGVTDTHPVRSRSRAASKSHNSRAGS